MNNTTIQQYSTPLVLNPHLLTINGRPLRFSLEGFRLFEFKDICNIIDAFGGKVFHPDQAQTLVLVDPDNITECLPHHYDVKFLEDSIIAQKLQNIEKYRLISSESQILRRSAIYQELAHIEDRRLKKRCYEQYDDSSETSDNNECFYPPRKIQRARTTLGACSSAKVSIRQSPEYSPATNRHETTTTRGALKIKSDIILETPIIKYPGRQTIRDLHNNGMKTPVNIQNSGLFTKIPLVIIERCDEYLKQQCDNMSCPSLSNREWSSEDEEESYMSDTSREECQCSACRESDVSHSEFSDESLTDQSDLNSDDYREPFAADQSAGEYSKGQLSRDYSRDTNECDVDAMYRKMPVLDVIPNDHNLKNYEEDPSGELNEEHLVSPEPLDSQSDNSNSVIRRRGRKRKVTQSQKSRMRHTYTEEDDRHLIEYLVKKKAINRAWNQHIWKEFLAEEELPGPKRTAFSLCQRFKRTSIHKYEEYTKDPKALQQFKKLLAASKKIKSYRRSQRISAKRNRSNIRKSHRYTDDDNRQLIEFIIEKKAYDRVSKINLFKEFLQEQSFECDPQPQAASVYAYFRYRLCKRYREYTDDPLALEQFEKYISIETGIRTEPLKTPQPTRRGIKRQSRTTPIESDIKENCTTAQENDHNDSERELGISNEKNDKSSLQNEDFVDEPQAPKLVEEVISVRSSDNVSPETKDDTNSLKMEVQESDSEPPLLEKQIDIEKTNTLSLDKHQQTGTRDTVEQKISSEEKSSETNERNWSAVDPDNAEDIGSIGTDFNTSGLNKAAVELIMNATLVGDFLIRNDDKAESNADTINEFVNSVAVDNDGGEEYCELKKNEEVPEATQTAAEILDDKRDESETDDSKINSALLEPGAESSVP